jgi:hypothetical protein
MMMGMVAGAMQIMHALQRQVQLMTLIHQALKQMWTSQHLIRTCIMMSLFLWKPGICQLTLDESEEINGKVDDEDVNMVSNASVIGGEFKLGTDGNVGVL